KLRFQSFDCENRWSAYRNCSCRIGPEDMQKLSCDIDFKAQIKQMWCKYKLLVPRPAHNTVMVLFEGSFDVCQFLQEKRLPNVLAQYVYENMVRDSNMPKQCPFNEGPLYFHNISVLDNFPAVLPEMDFTLFLTFSKPNTTNEVELILKGSLLE
ncbi:hypothetical protein KR093_004044, partial [Drosophila rubida]